MGFKECLELGVDFMEISSGMIFTSTGPISITSSAVSFGRAALSRV